MGYSPIYGPFINSMLEKRAQDIKEQLAAEEIQAKQSAAMMESIGSTIDSGVKGFQDIMKTNKENAIYNNLGQTAFKDTWGGGGQTEFDARLNLMKAQNAGLGQSATENRFITGQENTDRRILDANQRSDALRAQERTDAETKRQEEITRQNNIAGAKATQYENTLLKRLNTIDPETPMPPSERQSLLSQIQGNRDIATQAGYPMPALEIPVPRTAEENKNISAYEQFLKKNQGAPPVVPNTGFTGGPTIPNPVWEQEKQLRQTLPPNYAEKPVQFDAITAPPPRQTTTSGGSSSTSGPPPPKAGFKLEYSPSTGRYRYVPAR